MKTNFKLSDKQIELAVDWWAKQIKNPIFDNGDKSSTGAMSMLLATLLASKNEPGAEQIVAFKAALTEALKAQGKNGGWWDMSLQVDYHPDPLLYECAKAVGIDELRFPCKTRMWFRDGNVIVAAGYGAEPVTLG